MPIILKLPDDGLIPLQERLENPMVVFIGTIPQDIADAIGKIILSADRNDAQDVVREAFNTLAISPSGFFRSSAVSASSNIERERDAIC